MAVGELRKLVAAAPEFRLSRWIFLRILGAIYLVAFISFATQVHGLIGPRGILPAGAFLDAVSRQVGLERYWLVPTLAWLASGDTALGVICWTGALAALLAVLDLAPLLALAVAWITYLSLVSAGQVFTAFQWDTLLLEVGFLAILLAPAKLRPGPARESAPLAGVLLLLRLLLFRLVFSSGVVKLTSGDPTWRDLSALGYHYETQPLPTPLAWYAHQLPAAAQHGSVVALFLIELLVPFSAFAPRPFRHAGAAAMIALQLLIMATGNYAFFNLTAIALALLLFDDPALARVVPSRIARALAAGSSRPDPRRFVLAPLVVLLLLLGIVRLVVTGAGYGHAVTVVHRTVRWLEPLRIVNGYGLFAVMTTVRREIVIEGSRDGVVWHAYSFRYKPGDPAQRPGWVAPHQPRLDWQMWFAALRTVQAESWFLSFAVRLLDGSPEVLALLSANPFPEAPPVFVRALIREYHFAPKGAGDWWTVGEPRLWMPVVQLRRRPAASQ